MRSNLRSPVNVGSHFDYIYASHLSCLVLKRSFASSLRLYYLLAHPLIFTPSSRLCLPPKILGPVTNTSSRRLARTGAFDAVERCGGHTVEEPEVKMRPHVPKNWGMVSLSRLSSEGMT